MAVSKRLRFEILKRDNHQCRYCGARAPETALVIDHVVPVTLGGSDDPSNLVAACGVCNGGKSSVPADSALVADVANDAVRWAAAMRQAADELAPPDRTAVHDAVMSAWTSFRRNQIPGSYRETIDQFLDAGLTLSDVVAMARVAGDKPGVYDRWSYFCGCCWTRIRKLQDRAAEIVRTPAEVAINDGLETRLTRPQIKSSLRWMTSWIVEHHNVSEALVIDLSMYSCVHKDNLANCGDLVCTYIALAELATVYTADPSQEVPA